MTPVAAHIAKAERRLAGIEPHTVTEAAVVAIAHAAVAYVRHEAGYPGDEGRFPLEADLDCPSCGAVMHGGEC